MFRGKLRMTKTWSMLLKKKKSVFQGKQRCYGIQKLSMNSFTNVSWKQAISKRAGRLFQKTRWEGYSRIKLNWIFVKKLKSFHCKLSDTVQNISFCTYDSAVLRKWATKNFYHQISRHESCEISLNKTFNTVKRWFFKRCRQMPFQQMKYRSV